MVCSTSSWIPSRHAPRSYQPLKPHRTIFHRSFVLTATKIFALKSTSPPSCARGASQTLPNIAYYRGATKPTYHVLYCAEICRSGIPIRASHHTMQDGRPPGLPVSQQQKPGQQFPSQHIQHFTISNNLSQFSPLPQNAYPPFPPPAPEGQSNLYMPYPNIQPSSQATASEPGPSHGAYVAPTKGSIGGKTFQCTGFEGCAMSFSRSEHLARHVRKHTGTCSLFRNVFAPVLPNCFY